MSAAPFPDVKHLKNLKIEANREYLPPLVDSPTNTIETSTGYDYPKPSIPFPNEIETIYNSRQQQPSLKGSASNTQATVTQIPSSTTHRPLNVDYLPPLEITKRPALLRTGAESRVVSTTARPLTKDYLPPFKGSENRINLNFIPSPPPKLPAKDYLPPIRTQRPVTTTTTTTTTTPPPISSTTYAPAANSPIPSFVPPSVGPYFTKYDEDNGYDYSKPAIGFDLPKNQIPVLNSADDENTYSSAPTNNVPVYTSSTTTTTEESPAPEVIYTPSHTLDDDGYRYKVPSRPFNFK